MENFEQKAFDLRSQTV